MENNVPPFHTSLPSKEAKPDQQYQLRLRDGELVTIAQEPKGQTFETKKTTRSTRTLARPVRRETYQHFQLTQELAIGSIITIQRSNYEVTSPRSKEYLTEFPNSIFVRKIPKPIDRRQHFSDQDGALPLAPPKTEPSLQ